MIQYKYSFHSEYEEEQPNFYVLPVSPLKPMLNSTTNIPSYPEDKK